MSGCFKYGILIPAFCIALLSSCGENRNEKKTGSLFFKMPSAQTNVAFENKLDENDDFNIIEYLYFYNGGGVAIGDINNDGLADLYFSSNQHSNKLYLNKGNFEFEDITLKAGVTGSGNWKTGVTMADVNGDGLLDIFLCGVGKYKKFDGKNQLFINNGDLTFIEKTDAYGLSFQGFSTQASFFDYDNDGDLDMFLLNHSVHTVRSYGQSFLRYESDVKAGDKLYRNELIPSGELHFTEVTSQAGIFNSQIGYGLGVGISDLNRDGYLDIYVSNDFHENDYLYVNQGNGTFKQEIEASIPHTSRFSMGNDIADINNDAWPDIVTLDMLPKDEGVIKTTAGDDPYDIYQFKLGFGYHHQLSRNTLLLNRGAGKKNGLLFSDIAAYSGIEASDWSWAPLLADFDNDGFKDLFIANGILRRPNDLDYINYISGDSAQHFFTDEQFIEKMPSGKVPNIIFRNQGNLKFKDVSAEWLGNEPDLSNGASYADLDNDGDLDLVINNINQQASVYRNDLPLGQSGYLKIKLNGEAPNTFGVGTKVMVYTKDGKTLHEQIPSRGWESSVDQIVHVGLGSVKMIDSVQIIWPDQKMQVLKNLRPDQTLTVDQKNSVHDKTKYSDDKASAVLMQAAQAPSFKHLENDFVSFNVEKLIPHMLTTLGPKLSVGDINGDKRDDFFVSGASGQDDAIFTQTSAGGFRKSQNTFKSDLVSEHLGSAFFDADNNGTLDLIVVSGGQQFTGQSKNLRPQLYLNDGKGNFRKGSSNLPEIYADAACVKPADIDGDGDTDLFIGGRVVAEKYGVDPSSFILINDGRGKFSDETRQWLPGQDHAARSLGMVSDAIFTDLNLDKRPDMIVVGEWMPLTILIQSASGQFEDKTSEYGLSNTNGWWNTISAADFDKDGDVDFIAGNAGLNSRLRASSGEPISMFISDIDKNGSLDHLLTYYNNGKRYPFVSRDLLVKQVPSLKRKFLKHESYRNVAVEDILSLDDSLAYVRKNAFLFSSVYMENTDNGKFQVRDLPAEAQFFPIFSFQTDDINEDGNLDVMAVGNLYGVQPDIGRHDAGYGLIMLGDGKGNFIPVSLEASGFIVSGEGRDIKSLVTSSGKKVYLVSRNNNDILLFKKR